MALQSKPSSGRPWQDILFNRRNLICIFQGFSSGLPLYVLVTLVPAWLRTAGIDLSTIGLYGSTRSHARDSRP